jgi:decaprenyl-phosphate phosphoribosyltransferase
MTSLEPAQEAVTTPPITLRGRARALLAATRPRQWMKNVLVIGAPMAAGRLFAPAVLLATGVAFVALCLAAAGTYLFNDVHDVAEDRGHPRKRLRPVASGRISRTTALVAAGLAWAASLAVAWFGGSGLLALVAGYLVMTIAYTVRLRREPILDLVVVAAGFLLRGAAGGVAAGLPISSWFLLVAGFGSLFLVSGKRYAELVSHELRPGSRPTLELYSAGYLRFVWASAATLTIVAYALWANTVYSVRDEGSWALWSLLPFLLGLLRYAWDVDRGRAETPEDLALHDRTLQVIGVIWLVMFAVGAGGLDLVL